MTPQQRHVHSSSPEDTEQIATALAPLLRPGDTLLLDGPIGAGKSHFARAVILKLLSAPEDVPSPTYTLVQTYVTPSAEVWHADLYRLSDPSEVHELGLWAAFQEGICLVEWPDRLGGATPADALTILFEPQEDADARILQFSWSDERWSAVLREGLSDQSAIA